MNLIAVLLMVTATLGFVGLLNAAAAVCCCSVATVCCCSMAAVCCYMKQFWSVLLNT